jgi:hypothetical protein
MRWNKTKIDAKKEYFRKERNEKKGKFTEFTVRMYYCIYKKCSDNKTDNCKASEVSSYKVKYKIYEGFYDGKPDHDNKSVIDDCVKHLNEMGYIQFKKENNIWIIYLKKPLDFLLEGEHDIYMNDYGIDYKTIFVNL